MENIFNLPADFESYSDARKGGFLRMKALKDSGARAAGLCSRHTVKGDLLLTGGLCECEYLHRRLSEKLGSPVQSHPMGRYAGALGAALIARDGKKIR